MFQVYLNLCEASYFILIYLSVSTLSGPMVCIREVYPNAAVHPVRTALKFGLIMRGQCILLTSEANSFQGTKGEALFPE